MSKISSFCDKVIEACWLAALVIAPLFINFHSSVSFEPDKSTMVRSIALVMLAAFIIKRASWAELKPRLKQPLFILTILLGLSYLGSTFLSVLPAGSWWGSYARGQGTYSLMGYFVIFAITALTLKDRAQLDRIFVTIILASIPVVTYGFVQKLKLDVLPWGADFSTRIASTMGNPIFLGSYLIMVIPLTIYLLIRAIKESSPAKSAFYIVILLAQIFCLILTESRGPLLGLFLVAISLFLILSGLVFRNKILSWGGFGYATVLLTFFMLLSMPNTPFQGLKSKMGRLGQMLEAREGAANVRLLIWQGVVKMVQSDSYRALVGYGPETMSVPYYKYCPAELVTSENKITFPDRSHNELFDTVITNGLIGVLLYLLLFSAIIFYAFKALGLITNKAILIALLLLFGLAGLVIPILLDKTIFIAVGVPIGIVAGAVVYLFWYSLRPVSCIGHPASEQREQTTAYCLPSTDYLLLIALFSALIGHFVETQFGIDLTASRTYFYIYLAIFIVIISSGWLGEQKKDADSRPDARTGEAAAQPFSTTNWALIVILILCTVVFDFIHTQITEENTDRVMRVMVMLVISWLSSAVLFYILNRSFILASLLAAGVTAIFFIILISFLPPMSIPTTAITIFYVWLFINILALAWALMPKGVPEAAEPASPVSPARVFSSILIVVITLVIMVLTDLNPIKGDIIYKIGSGQEGARSWEIALNYYEQALGLSMDKGNYYGASARMCLEKYYAEKDPPRKKAWYDRCLDYLNKSIEYDAMNPTRNANLGRFYRVQGREAKDTARRTEQFNLAIRYYESACELSPQHPALRNELGEVYHEMGRYDEAIKQYEKSLTISSDFSETYSHLGDAYLERKDINNAVKNYYEAVKIQERIMPDLREQNQEIMFERANVTVIKSYPQDYRAYYNLGRYYANKGKRDQAIEILAKALTLADDKTKPAIREILERLK
jgi:tetratricopeptide (TPR) repeat protein